MSNNPLYELALLETVLDVGYQLRCDNGWFIVENTWETDPSAKFLTRAQTLPDALTQAVKLIND